MTPERATDIINQCYEQLVKGRLRIKDDPNSAPTDVWFARPAYAHHPTEVLTTINVTARYDHMGNEGEVTIECVFDPASDEILSLKIKYDGHVYEYGEGVKLVLLNF